MIIAMIHKVLPPMLQSLRHLWSNKTINYSFMMLIILLGVILPCWYYQLNTWVTPLILGVIAAALAESDSSGTGRVTSLLLTFICFATAAFSVEYLFDKPLWFAIGLFVSTFGFIILGAIGPRYASIAFGSILLAIYAMLGTHGPDDIWLQPLLLLSGSSWYYLISSLWRLLWPTQPIQQSLAHIFEQTAHYFEIKAEMFHPTDNMSPQPFRVEEAKRNGNLVAALNAGKLTFLNRAKHGQVTGSGMRYLNIYFHIQDIHERITSSHYRYQDLASDFKHSDVLFRVKHLLQTQAQCCRDIAHSLKVGSAYHHNAKCSDALSALQQSIQHLNDQNNPSWQSSLRQLEYVFQNLTTVESLLNNIHNPDVPDLEDIQLSDSTPKNGREALSRIRSHLNIDSLLFRHALRLAITLTLGYGIIQAFDLDRGYWILLTTLFVCQPNYSATKQKLAQRIIGTIAGLLIGWLLLVIFPSQESQMAFIVVAGVLFFAFRINNYSYATGFITLMVLFCFNQLGQGFAVISPRLFDTLVGCGLAAFALWYILPDWHSRKINKVMAESVHANLQYLSQSISQYRIGKKDNLAYRVARRDAHDKDANLAAAINHMLAEPGKYQKHTQESFRFLSLNHAMLSYISTLGAHRKRINNERAHTLIFDAFDSIYQHLNYLEQQFERTSPNEIERLSNLDENDIEQRLAQWHDDDSATVKLVLQQLSLIYHMLPEMHDLANRLSAAQHLEQSAESV